MSQYNDLRFTRLISSRTNMCGYKKLPHNLKQEFGEAHLMFEKSAAKEDWDSDEETTLRDLLLRLAEVLVSRINVKEKEKSLVSIKGNIERL